GQDGRVHAGRPGSLRQLPPPPGRQARGGPQGGDRPGAEQNHASQVRHVPLHLDRRSEEHTSELQSRENLVCRLLLEKKKNSIPERSARFPHQATAILGINGRGRLRKETLTTKPAARSAPHRTLCRPVGGVAAVLALL